MQGFPPLPPSPSCKRVTASSAPSQCSLITGHIGFVVRQLDGTIGSEYANYYYILHIAAYYCDWGVGGAHECSNLVVLACTLCCLHLLGPQSCWVLLTARRTSAGGIRFVAATDDHGTCSSYQPSCYACAIWYGANSCIAQKLAWPSTLRKSCSRRGTVKEYRVIRRHYSLRKE